MYCFPMIPYMFPNAPIFPSHTYTLFPTPDLFHIDYRYSSSDSSFYGSISDSDYDIRQKDLEMQLLEIRRQKTEILERQSKHKEELNELHENYQKQISELSVDKDTILSNLHTTSETNLAQVLFLLTIQLL